MRTPINRRDMLMTSLKAGAACFLAPYVGYGSTNSNTIMDRNNSNIIMDSNISNIIEKTIPATGERIPVIGLGTWQTFDVGSSATKRATLEEVLKLFVQHGGKLLDSSPMYGSSEAVAGALAQKLGLHPSLFMATKVWTSGEEKGRQQMKESMELLKVRTLDLMQVHNLVDYKVHLKTLNAWKEEGKLRYTGITHYTTSSYPDLMRAMEEHPVDFVQFNYSILTRQAEKTILPFAADKGVAVIINRPFEGGAMFSRVKGIALPEWAAEFDCKSWGQFSLKYIISHPAVTCAIPATDKPNHLLDNMGAAYGKLPDDAMRKRMVSYFEAL